mmetsp:Transcript_32715/g.58592  ORF Transcript_32715/g.58592 Transcript_32715/m.58592 type:complete len:80 (+) Transcript_32715:554-793(+)
MDGLARCEEARLLLGGSVVDPATTAAGRPCRRAARCKVFADDNATLSLGMSPKPRGAAGAVKGVRISGEAGSFGDEYSS